MSRYKLAQLTGLSGRAISYWEEERRSISMENADKILKALGVTYTIGKDGK